MKSRTVKMTKEEYWDFVKITQRLNISYTAKEHSDGFLVTADDTDLAYIGY